MKIFFAMSLLVAAPSFAVQYIDCVPQPSDNNDHVIVSLKDGENGTLFLSSGINDDGSTENSGVIPMHFAKIDGDQSVFHATNTTGEFDFSLPTKLIGAKTYERFKREPQLYRSQLLHALVLSFFHSKCYCDWPLTCNFSSQRSIERQSLRLCLF